MAANRAKGGLGGAALLVAAIPVTVLLVAVLGKFAGLFDRGVSYGLLTMIAARYLAYAAAAFAVLSLVTALGDMRRRGLTALAAVVLAGVVVAGFVRHDMDLRGGARTDVSTDPADPPALAGSSGAPGTCDGLVAVPTQLTAEQVSAALVGSGFQITRAGLFDVRATREAFWFGGRHDVSVRIRPGRTDIRVANRYADSSGASCRLALRVRDALQASR